MRGAGARGGTSGGGGGRIGKMGKKTFSVSPSDYELKEEVGYGASATVYRAIYLPTKEVIAVKRLDLDRCNSNLDDIRREAQTMSLIEHPNVIRAYCSFVVERFLWVVMPFMAEGSCLHLMKIAYPDGFEEPAICSILKETLKALEYLHQHGHIHRDVKAGNILLDSTGVVKLGDFGVSACMFDRGDRQRSRNTFVGTPCWMAPEVLQPGSGYDFKADIWSFGITALELAHGHAPFSKYPPMKVLLMTIQNAPPGLDYDRDKKFSKSFKEMVAMCLVKDQTKRPTAERLLKHSFFKNAKPPDSILKNLLVGLPPLWVRVKELQQKDAQQLALKKMPSSAEQEALSQSEYQRGVSAWNFDVEDLKIQAALIQDEEELSGIKEDNGCLKSSEKEASTSGTTASDDAICKAVSNGTERSESRTFRANDEIVEEFSNSSSQRKVDGSEPGKLKNDPARTSKDLASSLSKNDTSDKSQVHSGQVMASGVSRTSSERMRIHERFDGENQVVTEKYKRDVRKNSSFSGPLLLPNRASANSLSAPTAPGRSSGGFRDALDDKPKANVVQIKGRFSVTSENVDLVKDIPICSVPRKSSQGSPLKKSASVGDWFDSKQQAMGSSTKDVSNITIPASILVPHLQNLLQQTSFQKDLIVNLLNSLQQSDQADGVASTTRGPDEVIPVEAAMTEREQLLLGKIQELQSKVMVLTEELTAAKLKHLQLQQEVQAANSREEDDTSRREGSAL